MPLRGHGACAGIFGDRERKSLQAVVLEHDLPDFLGHRFEQVDALGFAQLARALGRGERDLDVHFIVRTVDARRIVDEVGIRTAAALREFDPAGLGDAEIGAFADHLGAHVAAIDPQRVVGRVADLDVVLVRGLDVGADAAEPDQVDCRGEDRRNKRLGLDLGLVDAEFRLRRLR